MGKPSMEYIAGFFDGEGSAMIITVRTILPDRTVTYTFRPIITITQKTPSILSQIHDTLGYGHLDKDIRMGSGYNKFILNSGGNIIKFIDSILPYLILKKEQLKLLKQFTIFKKRHQNSEMYSTKVLEEALDYRDKIHRLNTLTRYNINLKYTKEHILYEYGKAVA
jgi:hypothetical protein